MLKRDQASFPFVFVPFIVIIFLYIITTVKSILKTGRERADTVSLFPVSAFPFIQIQHANISKTARRKFSLSKALELT